MMAVPTCQIQNSKPRRFAQNSTKCLSINRRHVLFRCLYLLSRQGSLGRREGHDLRAPPRESGKHRKIMFGLGLDQLALYSIQSSSDHVCREGKEMVPDPPLKSGLEQ